MRCAIIGGTGTLGQALAYRLISLNHSVSVFSRCELKQSEMRLKFPSVAFTVGDIRDAEAVKKFLSRGYDVVYHVAALKHVEVLEKNPEESIKTNIQGTINVANACEASNIPVCVFSSTDKAVDPINVYGMSKGIAEKILFHRNSVQSATKYSVFRWGNVVGSRGSAIPKFIKSIQLGEKIKVTDPLMTRYWIKIEDAVDFMVWNQSSAPNDSACIPPMKSATVNDVISALVHVLGKKFVSYDVIGNRGGEKNHEMIQSAHSESPLGSLTAQRFDRSELIEFLTPICEAFK